MNERILELYRQAQVPHTSIDPSNNMPYETTIFSAENFAELIVRDVLVICDAVSEPFEDSEMNKNIPGALVVAEMVRENFGVQ
jgi:hypothetical protein